MKDVKLRWFIGLKRLHKPRNFKPFLFICSALFLIVTSNSCSEDPAPDPVVTSIKLSTTSTTLSVGESITLTATITPENATDKAIYWASSNASVASVANGKVTANSVGTATITAQIGTVKAQCIVTVNPIGVASVTLNKTSVSLFIGETTNLTATVAPENATDKTVTWSSSNTSVATVANGKVTAISVGSATITAQAGSIKANCIVTVSPIEATAITLSQTNATLFIGEALTLTATVSPENTTNKTIIWSTSNDSIASVANGKVTANSVGTATITAQIGSVMAECTITVMPIEPTQITLSHSSISLLLGESATLTATVYPDNATDKTVTWSTSNSNIATVADGKVVAVGVGTTTITAQAGEIKVECNVTVSPIEVTAITLNQTSAAISVGETINLIATITPDNATYQTLTWSSSNTGIATVSDGLVTAISIGTTDITVKSQNGLSATCRISVINKPPHGGSEGTGEEEW